MVREETSTFVQTLPYGFMLAKQIEKCNDLSGGDPMLFAKAVRGLYRLLTEEKKKVVDAKFINLKSKMTAVHIPHFDPEDKNLVFTHWLRTRNYTFAQVMEASDTFFDAIMDVLSEKGYLEKLLTKKFGGASKDFTE